jgi:hypothetical protein
VLLQTLRVLVRGQMVCVSEHGSELAQGLSLLWLLPLAEAKEAMRILLPVCAYAPGLGDKLAVMVRKELYSNAAMRNAARVRLAVFAQSEFMSLGLLPSKSQQLEALTVLKPLLASSSPCLSIRTEMYSGLHRIVAQLAPKKRRTRCSDTSSAAGGSSSGGGAGGGGGGEGMKEGTGVVLHGESVEMMHELIVLRYTRLVRERAQDPELLEDTSAPQAERGMRMHAGRRAGGEDEGRVSLNLARCFETLALNGRRLVRLRESVAHLVVWCLCVYPYVYACLLSLYLCVCVDPSSLHSPPPFCFLCPFSLVPCPVLSCGTPSTGPLICPPKCAAFV